MIRTSPLSRRVLFLALMAMMLWLVPPPIGVMAAPKNEHVQGQDSNSSLCKELFKLADLRRFSLQKESLQDSAGDTKNRVLKEFVIDGVDLPETGSVSFPGLDIDGDGKEDSVIRGCGSGLGRLCSLFVEFSRGGKIHTEDGPPFYIARMNGAVYMVEEIDGKTSPYTKTSSTRISVVQYMGIQPVCEKKQ